MAQRPYSALAGYWRCGIDAQWRGMAFGRMDLTRINPVTLITGAASGIGAACARDLGKRSQGGLILIDHDETALAGTADDLEATSSAPERVSLLAFDMADADRWAQASAFIHSQYGRLDWAIVSASATKPSSAAQTDLVDWGPPKSLEGAVLTLRTAMPLIAANSQGGAIVVSTTATALKPEARGPLKADFLQLMRVAAKEGAPDKIRINAIAMGGAEMPTRKELPWFNDIVKQAGNERGAFDKISKLATPLARYAAADDVGRLIVMLLSDDAPSGVTLVVDDSNSP